MKLKEQIQELQNNHTKEVENLKNKYNKSSLESTTNSQDKL